MIGDNNINSKKGEKVEGKETVERADEDKIKSNEEERKNDVQADSNSSQLVNSNRLVIKL